MTRQQIKEMAKAQLGGKIFGNTWLIAVVVVPTPTICIDGINIASIVRLQADCKAICCSIATDGFNNKEAVFGQRIFSGSRENVVTARGRTGIVSGIIVHIIGAVFVVYDFNHVNSTLSGPETISPRGATDSNQQREKEIKFSHIIN